MSEDGIKKAEAQLKSAANIADIRGIEMTTVIGKKSGRRYAFMPVERQELVRARMEGFSIVQKSENPDMEVPSADTSEGQFVVGDTVLMEIPEELRARQLKAGVDKQDGQLRAIRNQFRDDVGKAARSAGERRDLVIEEGENELRQAEEEQKKRAVGRVAVAIGAGIDAKGNVVK